MNQSSCKHPDCTFDITGACIKSFPEGQCSFRDGIEEDSPVVGTLDSSTEVENNEASLESVENLAQALSYSDLAAPVLERPSEIPRLPSSGALGLDRANRLLNKQRATVIGIVGLPDSGKTACLASIYLLLAKDQLDGFTYANSETLMAFEEIARGTRRWNGGKPPKQMTVHTEMAEDREAGFLHLRLLRKHDESLVDLLVPDLPGEWSTTLINRNDTLHFDFLKSTSVIWMMIDGRQLIDKSNVTHTVHQAKCLIERLANFLTKPYPRVIIVSSWRDLGDIQGDAIDRIRAEGAFFGININMVSIASFSEKQEVKPGEGIAELIESSLCSELMPSPKFWPDELPENSTRSLFKFRSENVF